MSDMDAQMDQLSAELLKRDNLHSALRLLDAFHIYGEKKGVVTRVEFRKMCADLKIGLDRSSLEALMTWCDPNNEGVVVQSELAKYLGQVQQWAKEIQSGQRPVPQQPAANTARPTSFKPSDQSWQWFREPTEAELEKDRTGANSAAAKRALAAPWAFNDGTAASEDAPKELHTGRRLNSSAVRRTDTEPPWGTDRTPSTGPVTARQAASPAPAHPPAADAAPSPKPVTGRPNEQAVMHDLSRQLNDDVYSSFCNLKRGLGHIDRNRNGRVDRNEMRRMCNQYNLRLRGNLLEQLFDLAESNGSIACADFVRIFESVNRAEPVKLPRVDPDRRGLLFG